MSDEKFDAEKIKALMDTMPLKFRMDGHNVRYQLIKIASNTCRKYFDVNEVISEANKLLNWINNE